MELGPGEPPAGPWRVEPIDVFARSVAEAAGTPAGRPRIIAVDGRGGGGKTALADRLARALVPVGVVHSDDVAWNHSRFGWDDLMIDGILRPLHAGEPVHCRLPAWERLGREGHIDVPAEATTVILEGVGVSRRSLTPYLDATIWAQSDFIEAKRRAIVRDMATEGRTEPDALLNWDEWEAEEMPFLLDDRPWERATFIVATTAPPAHDPQTSVVLSG